MLPTLSLFALSALATALLLGWLLRSGLAHRIALDQPNARSLHAAPVPRIGGVIAVPCALALATSVTDLPPVLVAGAVALVVLGVVDDRQGLPITLRLAVQAGVAALLVFTANQPSLGWVGGLALTAATVWAMNAFNFMDGSDGLAGGMALIGFGACAIAATAAGDSSLALLCAALSGAALGFLRFNFAPARVFLGDAGSIPLGFLALAVAVHGAVRGSLPAWFVPVVFSPFLVDATLTLLMRAVRGQRIWQAHREHIYQRLVRSGLGHRRTALLAYGAMLASAALALGGLTLPAPGQAALVTAWAVVSVFGFVALRRRWPAT